MTEQEFKALSLDDKIKITNIVIGVVRKPSEFIDNKLLRYPVWLTPEADLFVKEKNT
jgi:hypothetical protein